MRRLLGALTKRRWAANGQSAVELALIFPLVVAIIVVVVELGVALNVYTTVVLAARQGAHAGAIYVMVPSAALGDNDTNRQSGTGPVTPHYRDNISTTVQSALGRLSTGGTYSVNVAYNPSTPTNELRSGDLISVEVVYHYKFLTSLFRSSTIDFRGQATERIE